MAPEVVVDRGPGMSSAPRLSKDASGRDFFKMSGSGNDFVFLEAGLGGTDRLETPIALRALCARGTGIGADGVVFLRRKSGNTIAMRYYNSDGSLGELCGNATLCATRLAHEQGMVVGAELAIETDSGVVNARMVDGLPEIDLAPVTEVNGIVSRIERRPAEAAMGFARAGVPHVVIVVDDLEAVDVRGRGSQIRRDSSLRDGANVNFVAASPDGSWRMRTYERGVEGETLACGTGAVAASILLTEWGMASSPVTLETRSGRTLGVRVRRDEGSWYPSLRGSADIVFAGRLREGFETSLTPGSHTSDSGNAK